jgi:hypothetical protein
MEEFTERRKSKRTDASAPHLTYREKAVPWLGHNGSMMIF